MKKPLTQIITGIILLGLTSCASFYLPEKEKLREIENIPSNKYTMKCLHKSLMYQEHLNKKGIKSRRVIFDSGAKFYHMLVEVYNEEKDSWHSIDPTCRRNQDGWEINQYNNGKKIWVQGEGMVGEIKK